MITAGLCRDQLGYVGASWAMELEDPDPLSSRGLLSAQLEAAVCMLGVNVEGLKPCKVREFAGYLMRCTMTMSQARISTAFSVI